MISVFEKITEAFKKLNEAMAQEFLTPKFNNIGPVSSGYTIGNNIPISGTNTSPSEALLPGDEFKTCKSCGGPGLKRTSQGAKCDYCNSEFLR